MWHISMLEMRRSGSHYLLFSCFPLSPEGVLLPALSLEEGSLGDFSLMMEKMIPVPAAAACSLGPSGYV